MAGAGSADRGGDRGEIPGEAAAAAGGADLRSVGPVAEDEDFAAAFGIRGRPGWSPSRLALLTVLQRAENLTDRQAAEAVRTRIDWQYLLGLPFDDPALTTRCWLSSGDAAAGFAADGGGRASAALHPIQGGEQIARYLADLAGRAPGNVTILERTVNGQPGLVAQQDGATVTVFAFDITGGRITHIWAVRNPASSGPGRRADPPLPTVGSAESRHLTSPASQAGRALARPAPVCRVRRDHREHPPGHPRHHRPAPHSLNRGRAAG
jgi:Transposase domain (DUF772)